MSRETKQTKKWMGDLGRKYAERNAFTLDESNEKYKEKYGINKTELNELFLKNLNKNIRILEVGSGIGKQLSFLQSMDFKNLYGIEINNYAVEVSKIRIKDINIIQGTAFDIPFKNEYFDLVFTSGMLIHIAPPDLKNALQEIFRCTKKYIWGLEYYADKHTPIEYQGQKNLLWKANFPQVYLDLFPSLKMIRMKKLKYLNSDNIDIMFLLEK